RRARLRAPAARLLRLAQGRRGPVRGRPALRVHAPVPVLGHLLPPRDAAERAALDRLDLTAVARERARACAVLRGAQAWVARRGARARAARARDRRMVARPSGVHQEAAMSSRVSEDERGPEVSRTPSSAEAPSSADLVPRRRGLSALLPARVRALYAGNAHMLVVRGVLGAKTNNWIVVLSGFFEPVFFLLAMGLGLGTFIGDVELANGQQVPSAALRAPAPRAGSAMNGAVYDSTWNVSFKLHFGKLYNAVLNTSMGPLDVALGEISYALLRGLVYATGFLTVMQVLGLNQSWTAILSLPAVVLIAFGFASFGMGITSYMKTFQQMDWVNFVMLPMFLFSATFYPLTVYPEWVQWIVQALPLWHGVELVRGATTGMLTLDMLWHLAYFAVMIVLGMPLTTRRLKALFLT